MRSFAPLIIFPFDEGAIRAWGELRAELERRGTPSALCDWKTGCKVSDRAFASTGIQPAQAPAQAT